MLCLILRRPVVAAKFPASILSRLKYYVYMYVDPRDNTIFYVGKGVGNRAFAHLAADTEKEKSQRIREIRAAGLEPQIDILVHGLRDEETARKIEASVIDLVGIGNLTNLQKGYDSREHGRMSIEQIVATYASAKVQIRVPSILININKSFRYGMSQVELYDATRSAWKIGDRKDRAKYAFAVYQGVVQETYEIKMWFPNNSTFNSRKPEGNDLSEERFEFVGRIASAKVRKTYRLKNVGDMMGPRNPITYVNC
jgi:hypothetical protein